MLRDYVVGARIVAGGGGGGACAPRGGLNMTIRAGSALAQTLRGTVVANGTRAASAPRVAGVRVSLNLTTGLWAADANGTAYGRAGFADVLGGDAVALDASGAYGWARCVYNYTATTDASGAFEIAATYPLSLHSLPAALTFDHADYYPAMRVVCVETETSPRARAVAS